MNNAPVFYRSCDIATSAVDAIRYELNTFTNASLLWLRTSTQQSELMN